MGPIWIRVYNLFIIVILPSIFNVSIYLSVRSSTRRVHALATTTPPTANPNYKNARDVYLLKHMLFIFVIFVIGWTPVFILSVSNLDETAFYMAYQLLQLLPELSSLIIILDLFWYNHDLRQYLKQRLMNLLHFN
jgi:hypothetical protein